MYCRRIPEETIGCRKPEASWTSLIRVGVDQNLHWRLLIVTSSDKAMQAKSLKIEAYINPVADLLQPLDAVS
jgi:hypothetical protein